MNRFAFALMGLAVLVLSACQTPAPPPAGAYLLEEAALPDYERDLDHAGFMKDWSEEFYHKGMVTYREACFACHGDR